MLFLFVLIWIRDWNNLLIYDENNYWKEKDEGPDLNFRINVMSGLHCANVNEQQEPGDACYKKGYRFDLMLAAIAALTWLKLILFFRVTLIFGPMFKII